MLNRRDILRRSAFVGAAALAAPMINRGRFAAVAHSATEYSRRTLDLVQESLVIDMLGLVTLDWRKLDRWQRKPGAFTSADFQKLLRSGIVVFHPAVDLDWPDPFTKAHEWMQHWNVFLADRADDFIRVTHGAGLARAKRERKIGIILGLQNSDHFRTLDDVQDFHSLGQRVSQLTYDSENAIGAGCAAAHDGGLTPYGAEVIQTMNRVGMAVDVSHTGDYTTLDAISVSTKPVLITHSNCRALNPGHPRCKTDDAIRQMASRGGVIGITAIRGFVRNYGPATIEDVLDHFDHVSQITGIEHLGVGSDNDLDGRDCNHAYHNMDIDGLNHPRRIYDLTEGLVRRGYTNRHIQAVLGGNFQRALSEIWV